MDVDHVAHFNRRRGHVGAGLPAMAACLTSCVKLIAGKPAPTEGSHTDIKRRGIS